MSEVPDIHSEGFWIQERANINAALQYYQTIRPDEATLPELQAFAAEMIRIVLHQGHILERLALDTAPEPPRRRGRPPKDRQIIRPMIIEER